MGPFSLDTPGDDLRGFIALVVLAIIGLSLLWTWKARRLPGRALSWKLRRNEAASIGTWIEASDSELDAAAREVGQSPFQRALRLVGEVGTWDEATLSRFSRRRPRLLGVTLIVIWFLQFSMFAVVFSGSSDHETVDALAVFNLGLSIIGALMATDGQNRGMRTGWWLGAAVCMFILALPVYLAARKPLARDVEHDTSNTAR